MDDQTISTFEEYKSVYAKSVDNPQEFWARIAENFTWFEKWDKVLEWDFDKPEIKWFLNAKLNISENCLDRHLEPRGDQPAIIWEPNDPTEGSMSITYRELHKGVCQFANVLKNNRVQKGDRVCVYMPMVPELAIAVLACARIGAVHSVVFAGFSSSSLADRINDSECRIVLTSDGSYRGDKTIGLKEIVDSALEQCPSIERAIILERTGEEVNMVLGRDVWWHDELAKVADQCDPEIMDSEDLLFILYTSGSTGKPKGMVHTCGGYMVYTTYTFLNAFQYRDREIYWCTADVGWITGHSYIVYGPLAAGATTVMFEGVPTYPDPGRFWQVVEKLKVNIFYTAPTAIRALAQADVHYVTRHNRSSLRVLGTVGEPINEDAWNWYHKNVGEERCPIVDTYWQTENGGFLISPLAGITPLKPTCATFPMPGIQPAIMDENGQELHGNGIQGRLCMKFPWPSIARTIYGDHQRYKDTYFNAFPGHYFTGDGCKKDDDGYYRITGRVDDVIIVSGHNLGTAEIEDMIDELPEVVETAVVGYSHDIKGNAIYAFVICYEQPDDEDSLRSRILEQVTKTIGPIAKPDRIQFVGGLPKTRSGKIMRRILRKIAEGDTSNLGDTSTLLDPKVVQDIKEGALN